MSRHYHAHAHDVTYIVRDIAHMTKEKAQEVYGIEIQEDGKVYDPTYKRTFENVSVWADFSKEQDEMEFSEDFGHGKQTHGESY